MQTTTCFNMHTRHIEYNLLLYRATASEVQYINIYLKKKVKEKTWIKLEWSDCNILWENLTWMNTNLTGCRLMQFIFGWPQMDARKNKKQKTNSQQQQPLARYIVVVKQLTLSNSEQFSSSGATNRELSADTKGSAQGLGGSNMSKNALKAVTFPCSWTTVLLGGEPGGADE